MGVKHLIFAAAILACMSLSLVAIGIAQEPTPQLSSIKHIPIALPEQVPFGWDPVTYANFRRRCQEVADISAANLPMGSGDYGYAEACAERGAFFHPVKLLPKPSPIGLAATPIATPGPDGHVPMPWDLPKEPLKGSPTISKLGGICEASAKPSRTSRTPISRSITRRSRTAVVCRPGFAHIAKGSCHPPLLRRRESRLTPRANAPRRSRAAIDRRRPAAESDRYPV